MSLVSRPPVSVRVRVPKRNDERPGAWLGPSILRRACQSRSCARTSATAGGGETGISAHSDLGLFAEFNDFPGAWVAPPLNDVIVRKTLRSEQFPGGEHSHSDIDNHVVLAHHSDHTDSIFGGERVHRLIQSRVLIRSVILHQESGDLGDMGALSTDGWRRQVP